MCGIWASFGKPVDRSTLENCLEALKARGPEGTRVVEGKNYQLGFTRLAINGLSEEGMQPMENDVNVWMCNGEIYNYKELATKFDINLSSGSDCEVLGSLHDIEYKSLFNMLDGVFALAIIDKELNKAVIARDPYGVRPLFYVKLDDTAIFTSEVKAIPGYLGNIKAFPPGCFMEIDLKTFESSIVRYHHIPDTNSLSIDFNEAKADVRDALTNAVRKRMMTERPIACLLSGGLDSSLIASLVQRELKERHLPSVKTFSIGFQNSEDLKYARIVAEHIGSDHTEIIMTPDDFFSAIPDVIRDIESYDITTVRASVGNWLVAREIAKRTDCKVIFNGDGSDEVLGGYLYFHRAPNDHEFERETERLLRDIHYFDVLRSDRCISSHGLEPRTPFLDKKFVRVAKTTNTQFRRPVGLQCEKYILRSAFAGQLLLPTEVLRRKKEAFSDGVSTLGDKCWYQECQERALSMVPNWKEESKKFKYLTPQTAESYYYRKLFVDCYGDLEDTTVPYFWMPKWSPETNDPSAKTLHPTTVNTS